MKKKKSQSSLFIETQIKHLFKTKAAFCAETGKTDNERKNLNAFISSMYKKIEEMNAWLAPLGIEILMVLKKPKREGKKILKRRNPGDVD